MYFGPCGTKLTLTHVSEGGFIEVKYQVVELAGGLVVLEDTIKLFPNTEAYIGPIKGSLDMGFSQVTLPVNWTVFKPDPPINPGFEPEDTEMFGPQSDIG